MNRSNNLFILLKQHKWNTFIKVINEESKFIDVNLRDENGNYLIQLAIIFNKIEVVSLLINKEAKLDIVDNDGRTILYIPIVYGYNKLLQLLLFFNKTNFGISLLDFQDKNGLIPLHYSININNKRAVELMLEFGSNLNVPNNNGDISLHMAVENGLIEIISLLIKNNVSINYQNNKGETPLHYACLTNNEEIIKILLENGADPNIITYNEKKTPLMYGLENNIKKKSIELFLAHDTKLSIQNNWGQTILHYCLNNNQINIFNMITKKITPKEKKKYYDLYDINGDTIFHIILRGDIKISNLAENVKYVKYNNQNNNGNTILHFLTKTNLWKKLKESLKKTKLYIHIPNKKNISPIDNISNEDKDEFFEIVTDSYLNYLRKKNKKWLQIWDKKCVRSLSYKEAKDIKNLSKYLKDLKNKKSEIDICRNLIKKIIKETKISFPVYKLQYCFDIPKTDIINFSTYTGTRLDVLMGIIYLQDKYNASSTLTKNLNNNKDLKKFYKKLGVFFEFKNDYLNFEIIWNSQKIFFPSFFDELFTKFNKEKINRFLIIPLGIEINEQSHSGIIIYDKKKKIIERFEPSGCCNPSGFNYNPTYLDNLLQNKFILLDNKIEYLSPEKYQPLVGFQKLGLYGKKTRIGDPNGYCSVWSIWWAEQKLKNPEIPSKVLHKKLTTFVKIQNISFWDMIRNYGKKITDVRDSFLFNIGVNINNILNEDYTELQGKKLTEHILEKIKILNKNLYI